MEDGGVDNNVINRLPRKMGQMADFPPLLASHTLGTALLSFGQKTNILHCPCGSHYNMQSNAKEVSAAYSSSKRQFFT